MDHDACTGCIGRCGIGICRSFPRILCLGQPQTRHPRRTGVMRHTTRMLTVLVCAVTGCASSSANSGTSRAATGSEQSTAQTSTTPDARCAALAQAAVHTWPEPTTVITAAAFRPASSGAVIVAADGNCPRQPDNAASAWSDLIGSTNSYDTSVELIDEPAQKAGSVTCAPGRASCGWQSQP